MVPLKPQPPPVTQPSLTTSLSDNHAPHALYPPFVSPSYWTLAKLKTHDAVPAGRLGEDAGHGRERGEEAQVAEAGAREVQKTWGWEGERDIWTARRRRGVCAPSQLIRFVKGEGVCLRWPVRAR